MTADEIIALLTLKPHPEGGWYRQTWQADAAEGDRAAGTAIYFLLQAGERSHWHRVDAAEIWHFYAGAPLALHVARTRRGPVDTHVLGPELATGQRPQVIVPKHDWQAAESLGAWTLVGCTVSPGFEFAGFELAPPDFDIPGA
ncbi:MAG: cupin domain-containing protein [Rhodobacteraceae bacterium]|nr:cupin domain-containing protein [Paracoccaceae bacterium]